MSHDEEKKQFKIKFESEILNSETDMKEQELVVQG